MKMNPIRLALLSLSLLQSGLGGEPRIVRILQFYHKSDGEINAVESWIDLNEGGRILQKFYDSTSRTNPANPALEQFELAQVEEYIGDLGRAWDPPLGEKPGAFHIPHRKPVEDTLRSIALLEHCLGSVIRHAEGWTRPRWDEESLAEMKRLLDRADLEGGQGKWTSRFGDTFALQFRVGGRIEWIKQFRDGKLDFAAEVFGAEDFPPISEND